MGLHSGPARQLYSAWLLLAAALVLQPLPAEASESRDAGVFLLNLGEAAREEIAAPTGDEGERQARFKALFVESFDVPAIGRFVLGRYWRAATPEERSAFIEVFGDVITARFVPLFRAYQDQFRLEVRRVVRDDRTPQVIDVLSTLYRGELEPVQLDWRMLDREERFQIVDVRVEDVSMAVTLRSEYASAVQRSGSVTALIEQLRQQVENGMDSEGISQ